jgi:hypothetical protein
VMGCCAIGERPHPSKYVKPRLQRAGARIQVQSNWPPVVL